MLDTGLSALIEDLDARGLLKDTLVVAIGEFGRSPQKGISTSGNGNSADGRDHWPYCYTGLIAGAGIKRGYVHGKSDATASSPLDNPVHPNDLLATVYHLFGISPDTIVLEPPEPAARAGERSGGDGAVFVKCWCITSRIFFFVASASLESRVFRPVSRVLAVSAKQDSSRAVVGRQ